MIKGMGDYYAFLDMNEAQKKNYLLQNFPWYCINCNTNEILFNAKAFTAWYDQTNFIEKDLWFKVLPLEHQKAVHKIWFGELNSNPLLQKFSKDASRKPECVEPEKKSNLARPTV